MKYHLIRNIALIAILILAYIFLRNLDEIFTALFFVFAIIIGSIFSYLQAVFRSPFDISPVFFFMIIISIKYGFPQAIFYVIITSLIPASLAGGEVGIPSFLFLGSFAVQAALAIIFSHTPIVYLGIVLSALNLFFGYFINKAVGWEGGFLNSIINFFSNITYFIIFGNVLMESI